MNEHPIGLVVDDNLRRNRLTVFFRLLLAIPQAIWLAVWSIGASQAYPFMALLFAQGSLATFLDDGTPIAVSLYDRALQSRSVQCES